MSTLRPSNFQDPVSDDALNDVTRRPATIVPPSNETTRRPSEPMPEQVQIDSDYFDLKGVKYRKLECLSDNTGEAQVFLVDKDGSEFVLKIYYPNFDVNKKLLQTIYNFDFEVIVNNILIVNIGAL